MLSTGAIVVDGGFFFLVFLGQGEQLLLIIFHEKKKRKKTTREGRGKRDDHKWTKLTVRRRIKVEGEWYLR